MAPCGQIGIHIDHESQKMSPKKSNAIVKIGQSCDKKRDHS